MRRLEFKITVPDKYTGKQYKAGEVYSFEDDRANEILKARTSVTGEPYAVEFVEEPIEDIITEEVVVEEKPKKRKAKKVIEESAE